jgi:lipoprotein-releasing system ATP-binding protein
MEIGNAKDSLMRASVSAEAELASLEVSHLVKQYKLASGCLEVLGGVSFRIFKGELVGIVGESGSGKSTLLHILGALDSPTSGKVFVGGVDPFAGKDAVVSKFRNRHIGFVFQHNNLLPEFSALENVMIPGLIAQFPRALVKKKAQDLLARVGMSKRLLHRPGQLSGGEQQRVAIARALINSPTVLLADEPSGNLDSRNAANIHGLFREMNEQLGTTVIVVTHNLEFARSLSRKIELCDGKILSDSAQTQ